MTTPARHESGRSREGSHRGGTWDVKQDAQAQGAEGDVVRWGASLRPAWDAGPYSHRAV
ncbi:hypothetical protein GCM10010392_40700 [Streptomyces clavifer]|nr:hypothetical protein GCM10010392_40700 [Streptomyces clavifer]